ncbi:HMG box-containing protein C19G7.04 [Colletotrichum tanaceti]|uniref:HMG box-containing protein C19G7.04 n=1 Tax=Colletotrichum tanaceti TaxID=1306861 RepID=A0A4U6XVB7_9PEZI|nr:HMG box-containing protein C19G7.04 [Colletotrichum tanaceti]KAJ0169016.1 HMG box-containing protein C19G7.04 [Colletotrichum tanaceti]TKW59975.1 HMG box-containing protein C19G7.04 [Colletotrichum tanaceti]
MAGYIDFASSSEEEFPDLDVVLQRSKQIRRFAKAPSQDTTSRNDDDVSPSRQLEEEAIRWNVSTRKSCGPRQPGGSGAAPSTVIRRRKLGAKIDNALLKPLGASGSSEGRKHFDLAAKSRKLPDMSLRLRSRGAKPKDLSSREVDDASGDNTDEQTEITEADISEFFGESHSEFDEDENPTLLGRGKPTSQNRPQLEAAPTLKAPSRFPRQPLGINLPKDDPLKDVKARQQDSVKGRAAELFHGSDFGGPESVVVDPTNGVTDALRRLDIASTESREHGTDAKDDVSPIEPPLTPPRQSNRPSVSPKKLPVIPKTPHRPSMDLFWSQEFVNEWNEEHSPKKLILPSAQKSPAKSPAKARAGRTESAKQKETKKAFEQRKHELAQDFLQELDDTITQGRLHALAESTGGIRINWSAKLNTTAGRANWRREKVRSKLPDGTDKFVTDRHHASIELAEKVIDDEHRLLNVVAHEFCHLANFMINGITGNPHGKEFKAWAAKCSQRFGDRGIDVTTKHTYQIDYKYVWECTECGLEYKRHSKSINPERHRCGSCKALLKQTKPLPRATGKPSEYQQFFKEQMKLVKQEYPKSQQKEVMKIIGERWAKRGGSARATPDSENQLSPTSETSITKLDTCVVDLTL